METKKCYQCKKIKNIDNFYHNRSRKGGINCLCIECEVVRRSSPKALYFTYKTSGNRRGLGFDLSFDKFMIFWQKPCYYCDSEIKTIGLDRIDERIGYTKNNIVSCCSKCNYTKEEIRRALLKSPKQALDKIINTVKKVYKL